MFNIIYGPPSFGYSDIYSVLVLTFPEYVSEQSYEENHSKAHIARSLLKEPKFYFYDHCLVDDPGALLENIVSNALKKELHFLEDTQGIETSLNYLPKKGGREIDFLITIDGKPTHIIEVKATNGNPSSAFTHFSKFLPKVKQMQVVKNLTRKKTYRDGLEIRALLQWLVNLNLAT